MRLSCSPYGILTAFWALMDLGSDGTLKALHGALPVSFRYPSGVRVF
jgi:hypothetical protein